MGVIEFSKSFAEKIGAMAGRRTEDVQVLARDLDTALRPVLDGATGMLGDVKATVEKAQMTAGAVIQDFTSKGSVLVEEGCGALLYHAATISVAAQACGHVFKSDSEHDDTYDVLEMLGRIIKSHIAACDAIRKLTEMKMLGGDNAARERVLVLYSEAAAGLVQTQIKSYASVFEALSDMPGDVGKICKDLASGARDIAVGSAQISSNVAEYQEATTEREAAVVELRTTHQELARLMQKCAHLTGVIEAKAHYQDELVDGIHEANTTLVAPGEARITEATGRLEVVQTAIGSAIESHVFISERTQQLHEGLRSAIT